ncbi:MAG: hypothetical protein M3120_07070 [Pseudomonadota bacterium]|nr:hypothetical protein [Pseudomonadota bacterium]
MTEQMSEFVLNEPVVLHEVVVQFTDLGSSLGFGWILQHHYSDPRQQHV